MAYTPVFTHSEELTINGGTTTPRDSTGSQFLMVMIPYFSGGVINSISDSVGNLWTAGTDFFSGASRFRAFWTLTPLTSPTHTITVSASTTYPSISFSGWPAVQEVNAEVGYPGAAAGQPGAPITPTVGGSLIFSGRYIDSASVIANVSPPYTQLGAVGGTVGVAVAGAWAYYEQPTAGPQSATYDKVSSAGYQAAFTPVAGPAFNPAWAVRAAQVITGMGAGA